MAYEIIDNFLPEKDHEEIKAILLGYDFPWFYIDRINPTEVEGSLNDYQFGHNMYNYHRPLSEYYEMTLPLVQAINPKSLIRIKANLNPATSEHYYGGWHSDFDFDCKTAVYYVNTNNGWTEFESGEKVESVANRLLIFDSNMKHSGVTSTDTKARVLINLNWM